MKKVLLSVFGICLSAMLSAQTIPFVPVDSIGFVSQANLANCNDSSRYLGDTVRTIGVVVVDGSLSEVASGSVQGGSRPFITIVDTGYAGPSAGAWESIVVMGVETGTNQANAAVVAAQAGDILDLTVVVGEFNGLIQLTPISNQAVSLVGQATVPAFRTINAGDIQDGNRQNILTTGEQWEGAYVELQNMSVSSVSIFSGGSRCEFTIQDGSGNQVLVADRFLPMVLAGIPTVNPNSPDSVGSLIAPSVGAQYNHVRGLIFQDENGCAGGGAFAGGYEINPFDSTDLDQAASPPNISNVSRNPLVPNASQTVTVTADIEDFDGTVTSATLYYSADTSTALNLFQSVAMTNTSGVEYSGTIPAFPLDSIVRYYIEATDDSATTSTSDAEFYTVRPNGATIMDIQFVLDFNNDDASPLEGDTVRVTGIVTASYQTGDLGYLYIQDPSANEYSGVFVEGGGVSVFGFNRGDEVTVTGVVEEQFGFTKLAAISASATSNTGTITPVVLDPSDATYFGNNGASEDALEPFEGMLVRYENPMMAGQVWVINPNRGFGEYTVGSGQSAANSARVLAGRQDGTSAQSSLDVSYISDTAAYGANLNVTPIQVNTSTSADFIEGMMYYSFGNHKLTPRNNSDFGNIVVSIDEMVQSPSYEFNMYPNPAQDRVYIQIDEDLDFNILDIEVFDLNGRRVIYTQTAVAQTSLNLDGLEKGVYIVKMTTRGQVLNNSKLIIE